MTQEKQQELLQSLEQVFQEYDIPTQMGRQEGMDVLKARLDGLGSSEGEALMEICLIGAGAGPEGDPRDLIQFYTTTAAGIDEANLAPAQQALNQVNLRCPMGSFQIYTPLRQMYHKYTLLLAPEGDARAWARQTLLFLVDVIDRMFDETILIADNAANWKPAS